MFNQDMEAICQICGEGHDTVPHLKAQLKYAHKLLVRYEERLAQDIDCETGASIDEIDRLRLEVELLKHDKEMLKRKVKMLGSV